MIRSTWWTSRLLLVLTPIAAALPLAWPRVPPLADLPGHMASYHVALALAQSPALQRFFLFDWQLIGNLGVDLLIMPIARLTGLELATKLVALAIPAFTALALLLLARQVHGRLPATALAAVPLAYNFPFLFGFVNYSLAATLALLGLVAWRRWPSEQHPLARAAAFALIAGLVWLAHAIGWVMLVALCGSTELHRRWAAKQGIVRLAAGAALTCLGLLAPLVLMRLGPHADQGSTGGWLWLHQIAWTIPRALRDRWSAWDAGSTAALVALVGAAMIRLGGLRLAPALGWPALALLALFVGLPSFIDGSSYVNTRLFPYALMLGLIAVDAGELTRRRQAVAAWLAALFCAARLAGNTASFLIYDASYARQLAAVDHLPRGAAVLTLVTQSCDPGARHRLEHLAGLATVRRDAYSNVLWTIQGLQLLRDRMPQAAPFRDDPSEFVAPARCGSAYPTAAAAFARAPLGAFTHLWLIDVPPAERPSDPRLRPVWAADGSALYRLAR